MGKPGPGSPSRAPAAGPTSPATRADAGRRSWTRRRPALRAAAGVYALFTLAALALWLVVGDTPWTALVNLATFWWALPAVGLLLIALVSRDLRALLWLAVPAGLWVWAYGTAFVSASPDLAADLRIASFNTFVHVDGEQHVLDLVAEADPDVLVLQEVFPPRQVVLEQALADVLPHHHVEQSPGVGGVGVWSRHPITDVRLVDEASEVSRTTFVVTLDVAGEPVQVVPAHLISPCPRCGASILERLELEGDVRRAEIGNVLDALADDVPVVLAGDLNSNERSVAYRRLAAADFRDPQREVGEGMGFTWPADRSVPAVLRIDWILVRDLEPVAAWVGEGRGSDHRPVVVDVAFPAQED
ncbi:endonuclease/exonuclease/phosphatase family protein [Egicoccus sp. AB-alg2]|uniref:endonuclease/exonuclease/phosphatase family protein n=1 Tax=Egicoccus sp. AB-alg2 TaxID=3242693 RepID=UPI00359D0E66